MGTRSVLSAGAIVLAAAGLTTPVADADAATTVPAGTKVTTALPAASAEGLKPRWAVVNTDSGIPLRYRTEPNTGPTSVIKGRLRDGATLRIFCYVRGETVSGTYGRSNIWDRTGSGYFVPDVFLLTGSNGPIVPLCGAAVEPPKKPNVYLTPRNNPNPAANTRAPKATARTQFVDDEIARLTGERDCWVGGYRSYQKSTSNHNTGNALDCKISKVMGKYPNALQEAQGWQLANWLRKNARLLDVRYVIWDGKIWSVQQSEKGWRAYSKANAGVTLGHYDHVHVSMQNPGNRD